MFTKPKGTRYWSCNVSCARIIADYYQFKIFLKIVVFQAYIRTYLSRAFIDSSHLGVLPNTVSNLWTFPNREIVRPQSSWYLPLARNAGKATKPTEIFDISCSFFYDRNLDFTWISKLSISFPRMTSIMRIWRKYLSGLVARGSRSSKSGFFLSCPRLRRDSGFSSIIGIIPTKSGWLDTANSSAICELSQQLKWFKTTWCLTFCLVTRPRPKAYRVLKCCSFVVVCLVGIKNRHSWDTDWFVPITCLWCRHSSFTAYAVEMFNWEEWNYGFSLPG